MARSHILAAATLAWLAATPLHSDVPVSLRGSPESMVRQHRIALESNFSFFRSTREIYAAHAVGELERLPGSADYQVIAGTPYARREVRLLVEDLAAGLRASCGDPLVVTSLTRPVDRQPPNAHPLSVHPAGMAIDLRVPRVPACRAWLENELLVLEERGVLDATLERNPPHYHVALFPAPFLAYHESLRPAAPGLVADPLDLVPILTASLTPRSDDFDLGAQPRGPESTARGWVHLLLSAPGRLVRALRG